MALDNYYRNKIESMKLEIIQGQAVLRRLEAQRNDYNSRVRLLREELGLLQQPGSYVGEVVKVMSTKKVLVKVHPEGKYGTDTDGQAASYSLPQERVSNDIPLLQWLISPTAWTLPSSLLASGWPCSQTRTNWKRCCHPQLTPWYHS